MWNSFQWCNREAKRPHGVAARDNEEDTPLANPGAIRPMPTGLATGNTPIETTTSLSFSTTWTKAAPLHRARATSALIHPTSISGKTPVSDFKGNTGEARPRRQPRPDMTDGAKRAPRRRGGRSFEKALNMSSLLEHGVSYVEC